MLNTINEKLFLFINGAVGQFPFLDHFFVFVSNFFVQTMLLLTLVWFLVVIPRKIKVFTERIKSYKDAGLFVLSGIITYALTEFIKVMVGYPRPIQILTNVHSLIIDGSYDSFPSLHTAFAFMVATFVYQYSKSAGVLLFFLSVLVGVSRIFVGVHFPLDILVGACIGVVVPWGIVSTIRRYGR